MVSSNLVVPIVLWGPSAPTHCVSSIFLSRDQKTLATGCYDGQICLWKIDTKSFKMTPRLLLVGHTAPVLCLSNASESSDYDFLVSSSENGEMCTWDLVDGKCTENIKIPQIHTHMQSYQMTNCSDVRLFCIGYYAEILIIDPFSLEVLFSLTSKVKPDWISALHVLRPSKRRDDVVLAITTTGTVKVWTLVGNENKYSEPIYENESKIIRCLNAITLKCCSQNQRTVLIVCTKYWQIFDAGDFTVLCSVNSPPRSRWQGGDFISKEKVILWSDDGKAYIYKLPANCIPDNKEFHSKSAVQDAPYLYYILTTSDEKILSCPPAMLFVQIQNIEQSNNFHLLRGDSEGFVTVWTVPIIDSDELLQMQSAKKEPKLKINNLCTSLSQAWSLMHPPPVGILDQLEYITEEKVKLTASLYLPPQSRLVVGREDGSIIIVPASQTVMLQLLYPRSGTHSWPRHQILTGHNGRVNCLLCPSLIHSRYDKNYLLSGGIDFAVCLWDVYSGSLIHRFCVHAGEITQLLVPPSTCSMRIQKCICSVASDHSVTLLSLQERKCICLASRHLFPVVTIKWRPSDDFLVVGCSDGTVYVWQMETGHLDRVLHGMLAEEVLSACDETSCEDISNAPASTDDGLANPAVHFFRGLRHRNLQAIRHATQRGIHQLQLLHGQNNDPNSFLMKNHSTPLVIQGLRTNPKDAESHILFFDVDGLIFELHSEEYAALTPSTLETKGIIFSDLEQESNVGDQAAKKLTDFFGKVKNKAGELANKEKDKHGIFSKVKEGAEKFEKNIQAIHKNLEQGKDPKSAQKLIPKMETTHVMETAQLLLSLLHSWGLDPNLDKVCETQLGLVRPIVPLCFGILTKGGYMSFLLPTWQTDPMLKQDDLINHFTSKFHWELSTTLTSNHILAMVAVSNTLMSMKSASFIPESERKINKEKKELNKSGSLALNIGDETDEALSEHQTQIKQSWSLLSTHHSLCLPDKLEVTDAQLFKRPQVETMTKRWQHHCIEIREASQQILLGELNRMGKKGRKQLVEHWAQYLPLYTNTEPIVQHTANQNPPNTQTTEDEDNYQIHEEAYREEEDEEEEIVRKPSSIAELKRKQTTAVILLGVIGAEFGQDISQESPQKKNRVEDQRRKSSVVEGFGIANNNLARLTSMALTHLLLSPPTPKLPAFTPLRRAAIDLIGRGFTVWEPHLDVCKVLLGLLEISCDAGKLIPNFNYKLPLTPQADACRTARNSLRLIATARPAGFITTMAREVARYNTLQQNAQTINVHVAHCVLHKAKKEILHCVEMLIDKMQTEVSNLLIEIMDIILHCLDSSELKNRPLNELCPALSKFNQISHCHASRRIAVGASNGQLAIYELRQNKCQMIPAHTHPVTALCFSPDGKYLVSYSCAENRLSFWQTSTGMFGLGQSQTKCIKGYSTAPIPDIARLNPMRIAKLIWINNRTVTLMLADGSETRFNV